MMYKGTFLLLTVLSFLAKVHGARDICCKLSGNGNYKQFDNPPSVHFRSNCVYNFASDINGVFQIWVDPEFHHDNDKVSFAQSTIIHYGGKTYYLNYTQVQLPNGTVSDILGFPTEDDGIIRIESQGSNIIFTIIPEDVEIFWHGAYNLKVCVGDQWRQDQSTMNGLCGNNNGDKTDDLIDSNGIQQERTFEGYDRFGESWNVQDGCGPTDWPKLWPCCRVCGDPHVSIPDGLHYTFNDVCLYDLIYTNDGSLDIDMRTIRRAIRPRRSWAGEILFYQNGGEYGMNHTSVSVGGQAVTLPYEDVQFDCYVNETGILCCDSLQEPMRICRLKPFCYEICFDHQFDGLLSGLCGNCNGNADDDLITRDGEDVNNKTGGLKKFINSWEKEDCP